MLSAFISTLQTAAALPKNTHRVEEELAVLRFTHGVVNLQDSLGSEILVKCEVEGLFSL